VVLLAVICSCHITSLAFQGLSRRIGSARKSTSLFINLHWFGSKNENDEQNNGEALAADGKGTLGGVSGIMESMDGFKKSQRIGKMTGALVHELSSMTVEGTAENGKVKVTFDCQQRPVDVFIDDAYFDSANAADVSDAITTAMKEAHAKSTEKMDEKMKNFFAQVGLPSK
jgi:DNA-binding YbaB/EbfC family protein